MPVMGFNHLTVYRRLPSAAVRLPSFFDYVSIRPMFKCLKKYSFIIVYLASLTLLAAQTVSAKKDIAVFRLSHSVFVPVEVASRIDQRIFAAIASFKRFNVIGMQYRLKAVDASAFIDKIKETKENLSEIPETVLSGEEAFTRSDWEQLVGAFLVFVPRITVYDESIIYEDTVVNGKKVVKKYWEIKIEGSLTIIDVSGNKGERVIPLSVVQTFDRQSAAIDNAIDKLEMAVYTAIKFEPEFALTSGIIAIDRQRNLVTIELGKDMGIKEGDEYTLRKSISAGGKQSSIETGFFIISEVHETFSIGKVIYANQPIVEGDTVKEQPIRNLALQGYGGITVPLSGVKTRNTNEYLRVQPTIGIRAAYKSDFHLSIMLGYEYAIQQPAGQSAVLNAKPLQISPLGMGYVGAGVYNLYAARFKITPELHFCFSGVRVQPQNSASKQLSVTSITSSQIGGRALISADYFITREWMAGGSAGIGYMHSMMNEAGVVKKLQDSGLSAPEAEHIKTFNWDILSSHVNFYLFIGVTKRF